MLDLTGFLYCRKSGKISIRYIIFMAFLLNFSVQEVSDMLFSSCIFLLFSHLFPQLSRLIFIQEKEPFTIMLITRVALFCKS